jgi:hypothetical protein
MNLFTTRKKWLLKKAAIYPTALWFTWQNTKKYMLEHIIPAQRPDNRFLHKRKTTNAN